ncbi:hypothetical protein GHT09_002717 [Marmota monax]|uniref:Zinc finger protein 366 n=1 Tax=Marmota monax TaxID=9995 RepID=A0A834UPT6_MARMO|nr:hypothetical protein GHT09_002717 [Marmota monax]
MQKEMKMIKDEDVHFNLGVKSTPSFPHCLQPVASRGKAPQRHPFPEALRGPFSQFRYEPPPGDLDGFAGVFEGGGSRKRKSMPTKMPYNHPAEEATLALHSQENKNHGPPSLPLLYPQPPRPKYDSQMIDLCNVGFQFYRTLEHLGGKSVKQEPIKPSAVWPQPTPPPFLPSPYPYYPKVHPGLMFPFFVPPSPPFHFSRHTFLPKQPPEPEPLLPRKGVKEHKCGICGREFTLLANMKRHVLIHTNIRAYQCHLCYKSFVQKQTLKAHMIVHSDVKPFKCKLCGKEFNRMHNLMGHMHLHSDSKPFKCLYCPSKFTLKGNLTRHMKVKHGVMERGLHSQGLGRGRITLAQSAGVLRSLEQEEPFDLSQKRGVKGPMFQLDGESARGSPCHEEEDDDNCYEVEPYSPGLAPQSQQLGAPQDLSTKPEQAPEGPEDNCKEEKEDVPKEEEEERNKDHHEAEGVQERDCARKDERLSLRVFQSSRRGPSFSDYLYFKHRDESLKELLERKMEKQAVLLGI